MHRHRVSAEELGRARIPLDRAAARHFVNVLRLRAGDEVELFDGCGAAATFRLEQDAAQPADAPAPARRAGLVLARVGEVRRQAARGCRLVLGACVSKGRRMDWTVEKAVELGVAEIVPILSTNCVVKVGDDEAKRERWERVATDAARQCGADFVPEIAAPLPFDEALARLAAECRLYAGALTPDAILLRDALARDRAQPPPAAVAWLVGPEGDFSPAEYEALRHAGAALVSLGPLVLRTETAALYGLCVLGSEWL